MEILYKWHHIYFYNKLFKFIKFIQFYLIVSPQHYICYHTNIIFSTSHSIRQMSCKSALCQTMVQVWNWQGLESYRENQNVNIDHVAFRERLQNKPQSSLLFYTIEYFYEIWKFSHMRSEGRHPKSGHPKTGGILCMRQFLHLGPPHAFPLAPKSGKDCICGQRRLR